LRVPDQVIAVDCATVTVLLAPAGFDVEAALALEVDADALAVRRDVCLVPVRATNPAIRIL